MAIVQPRIPQLPPSSNQNGGCRAGLQAGTLWSVNRQEFWDVIEQARADVGSAAADAVAARATEVLALLPPAQIAAAAQPLWDLMADSYRGDLWAAAYLINGGASDDGFEYFRGWLITQGREVFERAVADPDSLADVPAVQAVAAEAGDLECEEALGIARDAYLKATGQELPGDAFTIRYPPVNFAWDPADNVQVRTHLPRLDRLLE